MAIIMKAVFAGTKRECIDMERRLRPRPRVAWNVETGGRAWERDDMDTAPCTLYWIHDSSLHKDINTEGYVGITTQPLRVRSYGYRKRWPDLTIVDAAVP
jgi:hypothetical protein